MSAATKVLVLSPSGRTGTSVVEGLLNSPTNFEITALTRESSLQNPVVSSFRDRGVKIISADLKGPKSDLVRILTGIDVVISCIFFLNLKDQIPLIEAAKEAGVKRFVPSSFGTPAPRGGVMKLADAKEDIVAALHRLHMPHTVIDVGWWSQAIVPELPSGRTEKFISPFFKKIAADGTVPIAFTHLRDVGNYVAHIITDPRTLNQRVLAYTDVLTTNEVHDLMDEVSGEKTIRSYEPADQIKKNLDTCEESLAKDPNDQAAYFTSLIYEYINSWGVRGDSNPETAKIFGYLDFKELYPDVKGTTMKELFLGILDGTEQPPPPIDIKF